METKTKNKTTYILRPNRPKKNEEEKKELNFDDDQVIEE